MVMGWFHLATLALPLVTSTTTAAAAAAAAAGGTSSDVDAYCALVDDRIPGRVFYPSSETYDESLLSYYSGQESDIQPGCIFRPRSTAQVSEFMKLVTASDVDDGSKEAGRRRGRPKLAVRSGGHMIWAGAANVEGGITVDMREMKGVELSGDGSVARLGAGAVWSDVYRELVPRNLTVMGGRVTGIGVGGFITGGGIHFLARRHGWACDNVHGYEVVLANGTAVEATASSHADLWLALKGGSGANFGVVTRVDVPTFRDAVHMWGGTVAFPYTPEVLAAQARAFSDFMREESFDDAAHMGLTLVFDGGSYAVADAMYYVEPTVRPRVYERFMEIQPQTADSMRLTDASALVDMSTGLLPPNTTRAIDIVFSFRSGQEAAVYEELFAAWEDGARALAGVDKMQLVLLLQPHPVTNGTNSLGLEAGRRDEVVGVVTGAYADAADDGEVQRVMEGVVAAQEGALRARGLLLEGWRYLNYADGSQDPIAGYGREVGERLRGVSRAYDPEGVFQWQVPGGFKLFT